MKIGLYGGTYDPPHDAHIELAEWVRDNLSLDYIYFIPVGSHAFKYDYRISPPEIRYQMVEAAIQDHKYLRVSRIELDRPDISYTIDTISSFRQYEKIGTTDLYLIIGIDNLSEFHRWKDPDKVLDQVKVVVIRRSGYNDRSLLEKYRNKVTFLESPLIDISATEIREKVLNNQDISDLVPPAVQKIILKEGLYK